MAARRKAWTYSENAVLIDNYEEKTIRELEDMLPGRSADSINCQIKRLKKKGKILGGKTADTKKRAYQQRHEDDVNKTD